MSWLLITVANFDVFFLIDLQHYYHQTVIHSDSTLCSKKTCDHVFDDKLNCPFRKIFGTLITKSTGHRQVFLFSHLTYFVQLLYLGKLWKPKYQQKLNKITNILQEDVILIKNLYLSKQ